MTWVEETLSPGSDIDGCYTIEELTGIGGMGTVYRARHNRTGHVVAIKVLHPHLARIPVMVKRFQREARAAGAVSHANVCEVNDTGTSEDGLSYLVMPYIQGISFADVLAREELSFQRVLDIFVQMLQGLQAVHGAQIVHRDMKPHNVLITRAGHQSDCVKLLDFGISKCLSDDEGLTGLTSLGSVLGTPHYMAPEQACGSKNVDGRADIFAVGVMLFETLTGQRPYEGATGNDLIHSLLNKSFLAPSTLNPKISKELNQIVLKALARDPATRYQSASIMAAELEALSKQAPDPEQIVSIRRPLKKQPAKAVPLPTTRGEAPSNKGWASHTGASYMKHSAPGRFFGVAAGPFRAAALAILLATFVAAAACAWLLSPSRVATATNSRGTPAKPAHFAAAVHGPGTLCESVPEPQANLSLFGQDSII